MIVEYETGQYQFCYDSNMGVGRFVRLEDGAVTNLETGSDCDALRERLSATAARYPGRNPNSFNTSGIAYFNLLASEYEYHDPL
jgi:hypothetical protein